MKKDLKKTFLKQIEVHTQILRYRPTQLNHTTKYLSSIHVSLLQVNIALSCLLHNYGNMPKEERDYALLLSNTFKRSLYCTVP